MRSRLNHPSAPPAKPYEPNGLLRWVYRRFFSHIAVDERWSGVVSESAARGVVVYVMRSISFLDFVCLDFLVKKFGLPLVRFVNDLGLWILEPFGKGGRRLRLRRQIPEDKALKETIREHFSALLFLRRPPRVGRTGRRGEKLEQDLIRTLVETQRQMDEPILLVPQTFVWNKVPASKRLGLMDVIFGPVEWPGTIRVFFQFLLNYKNALLRSGEPFDLQRFMSERQDLTDGEMADKVRYALLRRMEREREVVLGPGKKTPGRIRDELLRSPRVRKHIEAHARVEKKPIAKVEKLARKDLKKLCAAQNPHWLAFIHRLLDRVWNRIYDGIEVDAEGMERIREAARDGSLVLLPSHKSHVDYLVLSDVLYQHAMSPPLIAAGDNLSFWPLGPVLRHAGAFFIKRSFRGKRLYSALVDAYMRKLLVEGFNIEFFLEGGRSRTGKLLPPKLGLLSMVVDAALMLPGRKIHFVPISIGYERIIEERSYVDEVSGGEKQKENIGGLLQTPKVLRSRYGRLYVQFGETLDFDAVLNELVAERPSDKELPAGQRVTPPEKRALVQRIAHRTVWEIDRVTVVTPAALVATAVLAHRRRGITRSELVESCARLAEGLGRRGARFARAIFDDRGEVRPGTLEEATRLFMDGKLLTEQTGDGDPIYAVPEERRIALEYYKNNILHFFVPSALIGAALRGGHEPVSKHLLRERVKQLAELFKYEFTFRVDASFDRAFEDALQAMLGSEELEQIADQIKPAEANGEMVEVYASMLRTYFETYRLALRGCEALLGRSLARNTWLKRTLTLGQRMYLAGELELRESITKPRIENALRALKDHGLVRFGDLDTLEPGPEATDLEALREIEHKLASTLT